MSHRISRRSLLVSGGAVVGLNALGQVLPRDWGVSRFFVPIALAATRLDPNDPTANFTHEGLPNSFTSGTVLTINDNSPDDISNFFADDPDAPKTGPELDIVTKFQVVPSTPNGVEAGVRFVINEGGADKSIVAACTVRAGIRGIGLATGVQYHLDSNYGAFAVAPWNEVMTLRVRRTPDGAEIVEVNGLPPVPRAFLARDALPSRSRLNATVEFGCPAGPARTEVIVQSFESVRVAQTVAGTLAFIRFRVRDSDSTDRLRFRADFQLGTTSNGIDPATETVSVKLTSGTTVFYQHTINDGFDVRGTSPRRRWSLNDAGRAQTGIERFEFDEDPNKSGAVFLKDKNGDFPASNYENVDVEITVGDDTLSGKAQLEQKPAGSGRWRLRNEG